MPSWISSRKEMFGAGALSLLLITATLVTALRTDGYRATEVNLNDASVWISGEQIEGFDETQLGRVNTELAKINFNLPVASGSILYQDGDRTFFLDGRRLTSIDGASQVTGKPVSVGENTVFAVGGGTGALLKSNGNLWVLPLSQVDRFTADSAPTTTVDRGSLLIVGRDGIVHTHAPGSRRGYDISADGSRHGWTLYHRTTKLAGDAPSDAATAAGRVQLTSAGSRAVVLDVAEHRISVADAGSYPVPTTVTELQQPAVEDDVVVVAGSDGLREVTLDSGKDRLLKPTGVHARKALPKGVTGTARPVVVDGCAYGAWSSDNWEIRYCNGRPSYGFSDHFVTDGPNGADLVFRVNHERVVLNDRDSGNAWVLSEDGVSSPVTGWEKQDKDERDEAEEQVDFELPKPERTCDKDADADFGKPEPAQIGARVGIPVRFSLGQIEGVSVGHCRVPNFTPGKVALTGDTKGAKAQIIDAGAALQLTFGQTGSANVSYQLDDGSGHTAVATIAVTIKKMTAEGNSPPAIDHAPAPTIAIPAHAVNYNIANSVTDPDGDPVSLIDACIGPGCLDKPIAQRSSNDGAVEYQPDGWIRYTPAETLKPGRHKLNFTVTDQWGAPSNGTVDVQIQDPKDVAPVTHDDRAVATKGRQTPVDVLSNDVSLRGEKLKVDRLAEVQPVSATRFVDLGGDDGDQLEVSSDAPEGTIVVKYVVGDGSPKQAEGFARIEVRAVGSQPEPVAVVDHAVARGKAKILVDVTANDFDAADNVLVVQRVTTNRGMAQLIGDGHTLRIVPPDSFVKGAEPMIVTYTVSNGFRGASGTLIVSPYPTERDQAPVTQPDGPVEVKAGEMTAISVLANDIDPEGAPLRLVSVAVQGKPQGRAFVQGDELRYEAPDAATGASVALSYTVTDAPLGVRGHEATGEVTVAVLPKDTPNRAPDELRLVDRAVQGDVTHISIPMLSADPDGDQVSIVGVSDPAELGSVTETGDGFDYEASTSKDKVGTDEFTFTLTDGRLYSKSTVRVGVVPRVSSDGPSVTPIEVVTAPGQDRPIDLLDPTSVTSVAGDAHVQRTGREKPALVRSGMGTIDDPSADGVVVYHAPRSVGSEPRSITLSYVVLDSDGSASNYVVITVDPDAPEVPPAPRDDFTTPKRPGESVTIDLLENDRDPSGGNKRALKVNVPAPYRVNEGKVHFTMPKKGVRFTYTVTNPDTELSQRAIVSVPLELGVRCNPSKIDMEAGTRKTIDVLGRCDGPPGAELLLADKVTLDSTVGTAVVKNQKVEVSTIKAATGGEFDLSSLVCIAENCADTTTTVTDAIVLDGDNEKPSLTAKVSVPADGQAMLDLTRKVSDPNPGDAEKVRFSNPSPRSQSGVDVELRNGVLTFEADAEAYENGKNTGLEFSVQMDDTHGESGRAKAKITVDVLPTRSDPIAALDDKAQVVQVEGGATKKIDVLQNDVHRDRRGKNVDVHVASVDTPSNSGGTARPVDGGSAVEFKAKAGFGGDTSFSYTIVQDSNSARTSTGTVTVHVIGFPAAPMPPTGTNQEDGRVSLKWIPPDSNGGVIDHYTVQCDAVQGGGCPRGPMKVDQASVVFDGLTNGVGYRFRARAHNEAGDGEWGGWSDAWKPDHLPAPPHVDKVGNFPGGGGGDAADGGGKLTVTWSQPSYEGTPVAKYVVHFGSGAPDQIVPAVNGRVSYTKTFGGLTNGTTYRVWVDATNEVGTAPIDSVGSSLAREGTPATIPGAPEVTSVNEGDNQIEVYWSEPAANGAKINGYELEATSPGNPTVTGATGGSETTTRISTINGETYSIRVRASNSTGTGAWGPSFTAKSKGRPDRITSGYAAPGDAPSGSTIRLSFVQPNVKGSNVNRYQVQSAGVDVPGMIGFEPTSVGNDTPVNLTISGLSNGRAYGPFRVRGCNTSHGGSDDANECAAWSSPFDSSGGSGLDPGQVVPFPKPDLGPGETGSDNTSVVWTFTGTSYVSYSARCSNDTDGTITGSSVRTVRCQMGPGPSRSVSIRVTASSQGLSKSTDGYGSTTDTRRVTTSYGAEFTGTDIHGDSFTGNWVNMRMTGFVPNKVYTLSWGTNLQYKSDGGVYIGPYDCLNDDGPCWTSRVQADGNGDIFMTDGVITRGTGITQMKNGRYTFATQAKVGNNSVTSGVDVDGLSART